MPKTVEIHGIDDDVYLALVKLAAESGISVPELLRQRGREACGPTKPREWLDRTRSLFPGQP